MDVARFESIAQRMEDGVEVVIRDPISNEPTDWVVVVASAESRRARQALARVQKHLQSNDLEQVEAANRRLLKAVIIDWHGAEKGSEQFPCTPENIDEVLAWPWFVEQITEAMGDRARFFGKPPSI